MTRPGRGSVLAAGAALALAALLAACGAAPTPTPAAATPASPLAFTAWLLTSLDGQAPVAGPALTLFFHAEHEATGSAGCHPYVASVLPSGDEIGFVAIELLGPGCLDRPDLLEQERQFTDALSWATGYRLAGDQLEIQTLEDQVLRFEPLPPQAQATLEGAPWTFLASVEEQRFDGVPAPFPVVTNVLAETVVTATFRGGALSGSTGCNTYQAGYRRDGAALSLGELSVTERGCSSPILEQEQRLLALLAQVTAYHVYGSQLWLETGDGPALVFTVASQASRQ